MTTLKTDVNHRPLSSFAMDVAKDWENVSPYARPYLDAMLTMNHITERYGCDSGTSIVSYFLANAQNWRGETARKVKLELKELLKNARNDERYRRLEQQAIRRSGLVK